MEYEYMKVRKRAGASYTCRVLALVRIEEDPELRVVALYMNDFLPIEKPDFGLFNTVQYELLTPPSTGTRTCLGFKSDSPTT